jgi:hypothetical protein
VKEFREAAREIERRANEAKKDGKPAIYSVNMMMAAVSWLRADDKAKALAAAQAAIAAGPDDRSPPYTFDWHSNIADVLM